jgi:hypothetical protein
MGHSAIAMDHRVSVEGVVIPNPTPTRTGHDPVVGQTQVCCDLFACCPFDVAVVICHPIDGPIATCTFCRSRPLIYVFLPARTP